MPQGQYEPPVDEADDQSEPRPQELSVSIDTNDSIYQLTRDLLNDGFGGVVLRGPPGTGKSWYALQIAGLLVDRDATRVRTVQFHPSYQYEDFVEGFVPDRESGSFRLRPKHLLLLSKRAAELRDDEPAVLVIDELSRADPARVFGEALTYIERTKRGLEFRLASGRPFSLPKNVVIIATMNVFDRGVEQIDLALERRLGFIPMEPSERDLRKLLEQNQVEEDLRTRIVTLFNSCQRLDNPYARIGHAYFNTVRDASSLQRLWDHQLRFVFERAFATDPAGLEGARALWNRALTPPPTELIVETPPANPTTDGLNGPISTPQE